MRVSLSPSTGNENGSSASRMHRDDDDDDDVAVKALPVKKGDSSQKRAKPMCWKEINS